MADQWMRGGVEFANCNCVYGYGCQFNAPSMNGFCEAMGSGYIEEGYFNDTRVDGLTYVLLLHLPGVIAQGTGTRQILIDARADGLQREALRKILHGEGTAPGATHFFVFNSTMSNVLKPQCVPIALHRCGDKTGHGQCDGIGGIEWDTHLQSSYRKRPLPQDSFAARI